jgi:hypothetical protein
LEMKDPPIISHTPIQDQLTTTKPLELNKLAQVQLLHLASHLPLLPHHL